MLGKEDSRNIFTIFKNAGSTLIAIVLGYVLGFLNTTLISKYIGAEFLGTINLIFSFVSIISIITVMGTQNGLTKYIPIYLEEPKKKKYITSIAFVFVLLTSLILGSTVFIFNDFIANIIFHDTNLQIPIKISSFFIVIFSFVTYFQGLAKGKYKITVFKFINEVFRKAIWLIFICGILVLKIKDVSIPGTFLFVFSYLIGLGLMIYTIRVDVNLKYSTRDLYPELRKAFFKFSFIVFLSLLCTTILTRIDTIMVGIFLPTKLVGKYALSAKISRLTKFILAAFNLAFTPYISKLYNEDNMKQLNRYYSTITKWIVILTIPLSLGFIFYAEPILNFFGPGYVVAELVLIYLTIAWFISSAVGANGLLLMLSDYEHIFLYDTLVLGLCNIILNYLLIQEYGINGAALASGISIAIFNILKVYQVKRYLGIFPYNKLFITSVSKVFILNLVVYYFLQQYITNIIFIGLVILIMVGLTAIISIISSNKFDKELLNKIINRIIKK